MDMLFRVINFLILAAALVFVAKKMNLIDKMFVSRRRQVSKELDEADKAREQAKSLDADIEREKQLNEQRKAQIMQGAAEQAEINSKAIAAAGEAEAKTLVENASKSEEHLREEMKSRVSAETMQKVAAITADDICVISWRWNVIWCKLRLIMAEIKNILFIFTKREC